MSNYPALSVTQLTKRFGSNLALNEVNLEIKRGSIHALLGMNGSGKSTLVKILSGFYQADNGEVLIGGETLHDGSIAFVHQDLGLIDELSVIENLGIGNKIPVKFGVIDTATERKISLNSLSDFEIEHLADRRVSDLSMAEKTIVAIARALKQAEKDCDLLVLDEPTSALPTSETVQLMRVMKECAARGIGVLFISHRLAEVMDNCDEATVLRGGNVTQFSKISETNVDEIVSSMTGSQLDKFESLTAASAQDAKGREESDFPIVLETKELCGDTIDQLNLIIRAGEIVGITSLLGEGVEEIGALLSGRQKPESGSLYYLNQILNSKKSNDIGYVTANRVRSAIFPGLSTRENASFTTLKNYLSKGRISLKKERQAIAHEFNQLAVYPDNTEIDITMLSGGNQQKVLFARWLSTSPKLVIAEEPSQGIDVHSKAVLLSKLREHAERGLAVVLISGEPEEITPACDRIIVLKKGRMFQEFKAPISTSKVLSAIHTGSTRD